MNIASCPVTQHRFLCGRNSLSMQLVSSCCTNGELATALELISSVKPSSTDGFGYGDTM